MKRNRAIMTVASAMFKAFIEPEESELDREEMIQARVAQSSGIGSFNETDFIMFNEIEKVRPFADMLRNADEALEDSIHGEPDFDLELHWKGGVMAQYQLWLGQKQQPSYLMDVTHPHLIYRVSGDMTNQLIQVLGVDE
ncbi:MULTISPECIES: hypothetical protein [Exiguobacterium]|uniref:hypothetical protein n=1 Tax=Exiguobacterium TaxID=33986 RepID=UPI001BEA27D3|nr:MULTISPECIES: hypothetical protein [Exiguobacterium]MCT4776783.1 hypothetical protein [Exiguobacterium aquaticum]MCT4790107.1 hypothetical protein [Exiguobacterium mexicanum]